MPNLSEFAQAEEIKQELMPYIPERCQPCPMAEIKAFNAARQVVAGEVTVEEIGQSISEDISAMCWYGPQPPKGCFGAPKCQYGLRY